MNFGFERVIFLLYSDAFSESEYQNSHLIICKQYGSTGLESHTQYLWF